MQHYKGYIQLTYLLIISIMALLIAFLKPITGYAAITDYTLAIFLWVVLLWMYPVIPPYVTGFIGIFISILVGVSENLAFSGFVNDVYWTIVGAYFLAVAVAESGIARRIGLYLINVSSGSILSIVLSTTWTANILSPVIMSNTARGGLMAPIVKGVVDAIDSKPGDNKGGKTIFLANTIINVVNTNWVMTGLATNLIGLALFEKFTHLTISWLNWLVLGIPMLVLVVITPIIVYYMYRPVESSENKIKVKEHAIEELKKMGPLTVKEKTALSIFVFVLILFVTDIWTKIPIGAIAILAMILSILPKIGIIEASKATKVVEWPVILWLGAAISIANVAASEKVFTFLGNFLLVHSGIVKMGVVVFAIVLTIFSVYLHAISPGYTAFAVSILPITLAISQAGHFNMIDFGLLAIFSMGVGAFFFPFNSAPNMIMYGYNYYTQRDMFKAGLVLSIPTIIMLLVSFFYWWPIIGIWK